MNDPKTWADLAQRSDLVLLGKMLRQGHYSDDLRGRIFAELERVAPLRCVRFQARLQRLISEYGPAENPKPEANSRS